MDKKKYETNILVPTITPFKKDESVDYNAYEVLCKKLLEEGAKGFYTTGSSAETFSLTNEEKKNIVDISLKVGKGKFNIVHCGSLCMHEAEDLAKFAGSKGADMVASVPPFYFKYSFEEIKNYYVDLANAAGKPVMIYSVSGTTGVSFSFAQYEELMNLKEVGALKYTEKDYYVLERLLKLTDKPIFSGCDEMNLCAVSVGCKGAIGSTYNAYVKKYIDLFDLYHQGKVDEALKVFSQANAMTHALVSTGKCLVGIKYLLGLKGLPILDIARRPFGRLTEAEKQGIKKVFEENY